MTREDLKVVIARCERANIVFPVQLEALTDLFWPLIEAGEGLRAVALRPGQIDLGMLAKASAFFLGALSTLEAKAKR